MLASQIKITSLQARGKGHCTSRDFLGLSGPCALKDYLLLPLLIQGKPRKSEEVFGQSGSQEKCIHQGYWKNIGDFINDFKGGLVEFLENRRT